MDQGPSWELHQSSGVSITVTCLQTGEMASSWSSGATGSWLRIRLFLGS